MICHVAGRQLSSWCSTTISSRSGRDRVSTCCPNFSDLLLLSWSQP